MAELIVDCEDENFESESFARCAAEGIDSDVPLAVEIVFTDGEGIRELNASTRGKDAVTDVLSFPNLDGIKGMPLRGEEHPFDMDEEGRLFLGSVVICREAVATLTFSCCAVSVMERVSQTVRRNQICSEVMCSRFMTGSFSITARRKTPCIPDRLSAALLGGKRPFGHVIPKMPGNSVPVSFRCEAVLDGGHGKIRGFGDRYG